LQKPIDMSENRDKIFQILKDKGCMKQEVYRNTLSSIKIMKKYVEDVSGALQKKLETIDENLVVEFEDRGDFEIRLKLGGDVVVFIMHTNVFDFDDNHLIYNSSYVKEVPYRSFCGMISVYNFLSDSFKYNRENDLGYLISRIFVNKDNHFFVEGKRKLGFLFNDFANQKVTREKMAEFVEECIIYSLDFDLLTPPYGQVMEVSVSEVNAVSRAGRMKTGKRLGFRFQSEKAPQA